MSRSSFAQSFFQSGTDEQFEDDDAAIAAAAAAISGGGGNNDAGGGTQTAALAGADGPTYPRMRGMDRRKSRRRLSRGSGSSSRRDILRASVAAAAASATDQQDPSSSAGGVGDEDAAIPPPPRETKRQNSWYADALLQSGGGSSDLAEIFGADGPPPASDDAPVINDEEVLEQYRIMAHVEASIRVKENTGFDMADYEKRRKSAPAPHKGDYYTGDQAPKPKIPQAKRITPNSTNQSLLMKPREPAIPTNLINPSFVQKACISKRVPELCPGIIVQGGAAVPKGEHAVRCLGCQAKLRVNLLATLVQCPDCSTVSPASSTKR